MSWMLDGIGRVIVRYLDRPVHGYEPFTPSDPDALRLSLEPGDVLLVEGNNHISGVIKYLTQSTWSHSALYVGPIAGQAAPDGEPHVLIEANAGEGVVSAPLSKYFRFHTRICRPGRPYRGRLYDGMHVRHRAHRLRLRSEEYRRPDALSVPASGAAALAPAIDCAWFRRSVAADLFGADRGSVSRRALSDLAQDQADPQPASAGADSGNSPFLALLPARLRHFALFQRRETDHRQRLQL